MNALPPTEAVDEGTADLDLRGDEALAHALVAAQRRAFAAVESAVPAIAGAIGAIAQRLRAGGRLHYAGAGSSGRIGVLDASEMPPTFGTDPHLVCAHVAGGDRALRDAVEGAEDDTAAAIGEFAGHVAGKDAFVGISASGGAGYVLAALTNARDAGAVTVAITAVADSPLVRAAEIAVVLPTGAEPIAGSTRMAAGTATKIALNAISTGVMVRLGKTYGNRMVDVRATNRKLRERALRLTCELGRVDRERAERLLAESGGTVKTAVVMARCGCAREEAEALIVRAGGSLRAALGERA